MEGVGQILILFKVIDSFIFRANCQPFNTCFTASSTHYLSHAIEFTFIRLVWGRMLTK